jgi:MFS transporter, DHA1 family, multidrug resistance protein
VRYSVAVFGLFTPRYPAGMTHSHWRGARWTLAVLLAALGTLGPFSIDTYLPAFDAIARGIGATPLQMQQTLSAYLLGFGFMQLFHGALSDSFGRRPVVLVGVIVFTLASAGCALSTHISTMLMFRALQGMSAGAGLVVSRALIRDMFAPQEAQKVMSQVTLFFGIAPAVAPMVGGLLSEFIGWRAIFWFLVAVGAALWWSIARYLPETLAPDARQPFNLRNLMRGYREVIGSPAYLMLCIASAVPFNGMFIYILASPTFMGTHMGVAPTQFFWLFCATISGIMLGAWLSGRFAGRIDGARQIKRGYRIMVGMTVINLLYNAFIPASLPWALLPIGLYALGWALVQPAVSLMVIDLFPARRGMAASLQGAFGSAVNALAAGIVVPLAMGSTFGLACASLGFLLAGLLGWILFKRLE